jgi:glycosyltransferase involved in cell wall biosynthesis
MKIAYLIHWNDGVHSGVFKKIINQINMWKMDACQVQLYILTNNLEAYKDVEAYLNIDITLGEYTNRFNRLSQLRKLANNIIGSEAELVYHRFDLVHSPLVKLSKKLPLVLEINTDDVKEYKLGPKPRYLYNLLTRGALLKHAEGMVFVTNELSNLRYFKKYGKQSIVVSNGIPMEAEKQLDSTNNKKPQLVFIGTSGQEWHGIDKIIQLAEIKREWDFHIIGTPKSELELKELPQNMKYYGKLPKSEYVAIMEKADVAIGTLSLHKKNMNEACPLKVREYLALGIPVIIGYKDTDFMDKVPYVLQLPNNKSNVMDELERIDEFVNRWLDKRVDQADVFERLDSGLKEQKRVSYFETIMKKK